MKMNTKKNDLILIGSILAAAVIASIIIFAITGNGRSATLEYGDNTASISLEEDRVYEFSNNGIDIHIKVENGKAGFIDSECPDHICEHYGMLGDEGDTAICLPAKAILKIEH